MMESPAFFSRNPIEMTASRPRFIAMASGLFAMFEALHMRKRKRPALQPAVVLDVR
jgi:hypothetical protein